MLVLISPSKNLNENNSRLINPYSIPQFINETKKLINILKELSIQEISELMDISHKLAELNFIRYKKFITPFTPENSKQAIYLFSGDVYQTLKANEFSRSDLLFANDHLRILSGLYGIIKPLDIIQPYRLEMGIRLENNKGNDLYSYWGNKLTNTLNEYFKNSDSHTLINLASKEYMKAIDLKKIKAVVINPHFKELRNGKLMFLSFNAKKARGLMSRYIIKSQLTIPDELKLFNEEGYYFDEKLSNSTDWVFVR